MVLILDTTWASSNFASYQPFKNDLPEHECDGAIRFTHDMAGLVWSVSSLSNPSDYREAEGIAPSSLHVLRIRIPTHLSLPALCIAAAHVRRCRVQIRRGRYPSLCTTMEGGTRGLNRRLSLGERGGQ